jgi:crotonobetainyl-CoA:carnitine CoA-transferase CaiB-like acyl-CoA transferase
MEQISGLAWVTGFPDGPPVIPRGPCDPLAGLHAALALLVALEHRRRSGEGQLVESTMVEAALNAAADQMLEWQAYGRLVGREGNRGPVAAPQNLYACRSEEQWLALAVVTDEQWRALVDLLGAPAWAAAQALATRTGRQNEHDRIDAELSRWCAAQERDALVGCLLARGIPAAPVLHPREAATNPQLRARGFFETEAHPVTGTHDLPGLPMRFSELGRWYRSPAPTLGQHTGEVLREVLGLGDDAIAELEAEGIIGERPAGA